MSFVFTKQKCYIKDKILTIVNVINIFLIEYNWIFKKNILYLHIKYSIFAYKI